ncbi:hypothetical protein BDU57DRAFT_536609 [Ampelomyces quisqualis]|uniref:Uncharacterized protein n=1 Tax=Ampelomyces quisqualis TaxID=50730 RepID=A0A6A5QYA9_AMPQU|nr:hypothetical protein BDU57DRAFT_536609 [Ampelomyces quisqualis]
MWLRGAEQEVERLDSLENSRPRGTRNVPHDAGTATQGDESASAQAGTEELVVQRETEESERMAEMNGQVRQIAMLRAQLDALDHLEARMGVVSTPTSSRTSTPYPSTYAQRWNQSSGRTRRVAPPVSRPFSSSQRPTAMTSSAAARTSTLATARSNASASNRNPFHPELRPSIRPPNLHDHVPSPIQRPPVPDPKTPPSSITSGIANLNLTNTQNSASRTVYPALADNATVTLMDFLTIPHGSRTGSPGIIPLPVGGALGAWPYQYPAYLQPRADDPSDPGLHRLARAVVQGRIRYNAENLSVARAARLDLDVEEEEAVAVKLVK